MLAPSSSGYTRARSAMYEDRSRRPTTYRVGTQMVTRRRLLINASWRLRTRRRVSRKIRRLVRRTLDSRHAVTRYRQAPRRMGDSQAIASHGYVVGYGAFGASDSRAFVWLGRPRRRLESDWCHVRDPGEIAGYNDDSSGARRWGKRLDGGAPACCPRRRGRRARMDWTAATDPRHTAACGLALGVYNSGG